MDGHTFQAEIVARIERHGGLARSESHASTLTRWMIGVPMKVRASHEIYGEWETADYVYEITSGAVRAVKLFADGGRQIGAFYFAGDIFGLEDGLDHSFSAEAIVDSKIRVIKRRTLFHMAGKDRELAQQLLLVSTREMARLHRHALMLGQTAEERLCSFLLEMAERILRCQIPVADMRGDETYGRSHRRRMEIYAFFFDAGARSRDRRHVGSRGLDVAGRRSVRLFTRNGPDWAARYPAIAAAAAALCARSKTPTHWPGLSSFASRAITLPLDPSASVATSRASHPHVRCQREDRNQFVRLELFPIIEAVIEERRRIFHLQDRRRRQARQRLSPSLIGSTSFRPRTSDRSQRGRSWVVLLCVSAGLATAARDPTHRPGGQFARAGPVRNRTNHRPV